MASLRALFPLDMNHPDLNRIFLNAVASEFVQDAIYDPDDPDGPRFDTFAVEWIEDGDSFISLLVGEDLVANDTEIFSGTATLYMEGYGTIDDDDPDPTWYVLNIAVPARDMYEAGLTATEDDDLAVFKAALSGNDTLKMSPGDDVALGYGGGDEIRASDGNDEVHGGFGRDTIYGGKGKDVLIGGGGEDTIEGGRGRDTLSGGDRDDRLFGELGNDDVRGGKGDDRMFGGPGDDVLIGKPGNDWLNGGADNDNLTGGSGAETFVFKSQFGHDIVHDFAPAEDRILLKNYADGLCSVDAFLDSLQQVGDDVVYDPSGGGVNTIVLRDVALSDVTTDNVDIQKSAPGLVMDQGQLFDTGGDIDLSTAFFSQSIQVGLTGRLAAIEVQYDLSHDISPVTFSIYDGDNPASGTPLYSEKIKNPDLDDVGVFRWMLSQDTLQFDAGDDILLAFQADSDGVVFAGNDPPGYPDGELFEDGSLSTQVSDVAFITYMELCDVA